VPQKPPDFFQLLPNFDQIRRICVAPAEPRGLAAEVHGRRSGLPRADPFAVAAGSGRGDFGFEPMTGAVDRESLLVQEVADAPESAALRGAGNSAGCRAASPA
jgi:hypothetical protein